MYLSPTGVRTTCPPAASTAAWSPPLRQDRHDERALGQDAAREPVEREDARGPGRRRRPRRSRRPRPAGRRRRRARTRRPRRARATAAASDAGRRRPGLDVDVHPVGLVVDDLDGRPGRARGSPARPRRPSRSRSRGRSAARRRRSDRASAEPVVAVAVEQRRVDDRPADLGVAATEPSSSVRQISCSSSSSIASSSFSPAASRTLRPLSSAGLWDAETMIPAAKSPDPARNARAGVGTQPATWTSTPRLVAPAVIAATNMSPERRVSWPTTIAAARARRAGGRSPGRARRRASASGRRWRRRGSRPCRRVGARYGGRRRAPGGAGGRDHGDGDGRRVDA